MVKGDSVSNYPLKEDFFISYTDEPHISRRKAILKKYPQMEELFTPDARPAPFVIMIVLSQLYIGYIAREWSWPWFIFVAWSYGGTASHALSLMTHELSHNLLFENRDLNAYFGIFCNLGMGIPSSAMFKRYHMEHHQFQGDDAKDVDIPTDWECRFFKGTFLKIVWLFLQPLFYAIRPMVVRPKSPKKMDIINNIVVIAWDICLIYYYGVNMVLYLVMSTLLGMGLHPVAGHFVAEHYVFNIGYETYSYYGVLNYVCWNVGYHNEHHDFPRVPGWKLPQVKAMAPEFYDNLPSHDSWVNVLWQYCTNPKIGPQSRVKRNVPNKALPSKKELSAATITDIGGDVDVEEENEAAPVENSAGVKKRNISTSKKTSSKSLAASNSRGRSKSPAPNKNRSRSKSKSKNNSTIPLLTRGRSKSRDSKKRV